MIIIFLLSTKDDNCNTSLGIISNKVPKVISKDILNNESMCFIIFRFS
ncbi:hypothetical protein JOC62_001996 [Clostridium sardiniense]|nr:hypothetical protein [Clostridium sardiniense]